MVLRIRRRQHIFRVAGLLAVGGVASVALLSTARAFVGCGTGSVASTTLTTQRAHGEGHGDGHGQGHGGGSGRSHADVAEASKMDPRFKMPKMPEAPADAMDWSIQQVSEADFMSSVVYAGVLCEALESGKTDDGLSERLGAMLGSSDGTRGFFVTYLTDPTLKKIADGEGIPPLIQKALVKSDLSVVGPLAIMNVAMPTATAMERREGGNEEGAQMSEMTARRGTKVLQVLAADSNAGETMREKLNAARAAAEPDAGDSVDKEWVKFYKRWRYDEAQMQAIRDVLDSTLVAA